MKESSLSLALFSYLSVRKWWKESLCYNKSIKIKQSWCLVLFSSGMLACTFFPLQRRISRVVATIGWSLKMDHLPFSPPECTISAYRYSSIGSSPNFIGTSCSHLFTLREKRWGDGEGSLLQSLISNQPGDSIGTMGRWASEKMGIQVENQWTYVVWFRQGLWL